MSELYDWSKDTDFAENPKIVYLPLVRFTQSHNRYNAVHEVNLPRHDKKIVSLSKNRYHRPNNSCNKTLRWQHSRRRRKVNLTLIGGIVRILRSLWRMWKSFDTENARDTPDPSSYSMEDTQIFNRLHDL